MPEIPTAPQGPRASGPLPPAPVAPPPVPLDGPPESGPKPARDRLALSGEAPASVELDVTTRDLTARVQLAQKLSLTGRYIQDSSTMMQGAGLVKLDYELGEHTTLFAGAGHMPGFYHRSIGPNERLDAPTSAVFAGLDDRRGTGWELGAGVRLGVSVHSLLVGTLAFDHALGAVDPPTSAGLSKGTVTGEATLSKQFGPATAWAGYGNHVDLGMVGSYYLTGGRGLYPQTHYLQGGVRAGNEALSFQAAAYVPLATATNDFAADPRFMARVDGQAIPSLVAYASPSGLERLEASKSVAFGRGWEATASVALDRPGRGNDVVAGVGLRYTFGGGKKSGRPPAPIEHVDYRQERAQERRREPVRSASPHLRDFFSPEEIAGMRGKSVAELGAMLKTPEQVAAFVGDRVAYDEARLADAQGNYGSMTPEEVATLLKGVCRDQHPFLVELMKQGQGVQGHAVGYMSPETSHAIAVYQDPASKKWNVIEYGKVHYTEAKSAEAAFEAVRPDALVYGNWSQNGPDRRNYQQDIHYSETAREFYRFVSPGR